MSLAQEHETLLDELESLFEQRQEKLIRDGFADPQAWQTGPRVLWVLPEPNDTLGLENAWRLDDFLRMPPWRPGGLQPSSPRIFQEIARCTYGLVQHPCSFDKAEAEYQHSDVLFSAAAINLKKAPGIDRVRWPVLTAHARRDSKLLRRQILLLQPRVVISGGVMELLCREILAVPGYADQQALTWKATVILEAGHPAHRGGPRNYYDHLMWLYDGLLRQ